MLGSAMSLRTWTRTPSKIKRSPDSRPGAYLDFMGITWLTTHSTEKALSATKLGLTMSEGALVRPLNDHSETLAGAPTQVKLAASMNHSEIMLTVASSVSFKFLAVSFSPVALEIPTTKVMGSELTTLKYEKGARFATPSFETVEINPI